MAVIAIAIVDGQLAATKTTLYTCPAGSKVIIKSIIVVNSNDTTIRTINLYVNRTGTSRLICDEDKAIAPKTAFVFNEAVVLEAGDLLEGSSDAATTCDYVISGVMIV